MSTNLSKLPISTVENSIASIEKVPKSIVTAEKIPLTLFGRKRTFLVKHPGNCGKFQRNCGKSPKRAIYGHFEMKRAQVRSKQALNLQKIGPLAIGSLKGNIA
jgi:hypothetical protein